MSSIAELCRSQTALTLEDIELLTGLERVLPLIADVSQADVFIDCPVAESDAALVVAEARPSTATSLYRNSVVGQLAFASNEPAVLYCLLSGRPVLGSRGISQEQIDIQQNVVPIKNRFGKTIGALIMERDISAAVEQEKNVEMLMETTGQLSETLLQVALTESKVPSLMHEGIIVFDQNQQITYTNERASGMLGDIGYDPPLQGQSLGRLFNGKLSYQQLIEQGGAISGEVQIGSYCLELKTVSLIRNQRAVGGIVLVRDISDLKEKEKQLMIKSAVIKEIHHRVKNNLQTVSSLLRLQMRRTESEEVKRVYRDSINRINSIAVIHEILAYEGLDTIDFKEAIERMAKMIVSTTSKPDQPIRITVSGEPLAIPSDKATNLALIVNELIQNSVVHGFQDNREGRISVELTSKNRIVSLRVTDNGVGIGSGSGMTGKGHLGLKIVETLVQEDLGGVLELKDTGHGTEVQIAFYMPKEEES